MVVGTTWGVGQVLWSMIWFFLLFLWIWLAISIFSDIFRSHDLGGFAKALWIIFVIIFPYLGVFVYLIAEHNGMTERSVQAQESAKSEMDQYVRSVAGQNDPASQIANAKSLLDKGAITQSEFDAIKQKALAG